MSTFHVNDLVICKPEEERRSKNNTMFECYARVLFVNREKNITQLDRYLQYGEVCMDSTNKMLALDEFEKLYQPMNKEEILLFKDGLTAALKKPYKIRDKETTDETLSCVEQYIAENFLEIEEERE